MRTSQIAVILLFSVALLATSFSCVSAKRGPTSPVLVRLDDVQGLFGGQTLVADTGGYVLVRTIVSGKERRYQIKLETNELDALLLVIRESGISDYRERLRPGVPDEARPRITVTLPKHKPIIAEKWAGDTNRRFDALYEQLLTLVKRAAATRPYRTQRYDYNDTFPEQA